VLLVIACGNTPINEVSSDGNDSHYPQVETRKPNSDYQPAFKGQTRIAGVKTHRKH